LNALLDQILPPLKIETLVNGGAGLARYEGRVVFIPHTAIDDVVRCRVTKVKKNYLEAQLTEILAEGVERITPKCPVAGECGGCQLQHLTYREQLRIKDDLFRDTLIRKCSVPAHLIKTIVPSPQSLNYRSRAQVKCQQTAKGFLSGFYRAKSRYVVSVDHCPLLADELNKTMSSLRSLIEATPFAKEIKQIDLAHGDDGKQSIVVHYHGRDAIGLRQLLLRSQLPCDILLQRKTTRSSLEVIQGDGQLMLQVDMPALELNYATGSFAQINLEQNRALVESAMQLIDWQGHEIVVDLYCGMGNFSLPLAQRSGRVIGVEESQQSIATAKRNAASNGLDNTQFYATAAEGFIASQGRELTPDIVLIDPPRSGAYAVMHELLASSVNKLIYVSCDPQTLARDLCELLNNGWSLVSSQPFDMFPQTFHCESLSLLVRD
jgi:23S rRNA (uracil1939-C5)-methyltransferase